MVTFFSLYIELPIMFVMYVGWKLFRRTKIMNLREMDLVTDTHTVEEVDETKTGGWKEKGYHVWRWIL